MQRTLTTLRDDVLPVNPRLFAVMAEGPLDYIREFLSRLALTQPSHLGTTNTILSSLTRF